MSARICAGLIALTALGATGARAQVTPAPPPAVQAVGQPAPTLAADLTIRRAMHRGPIRPPAILADEAEGATVWLGLRRAPSAADARELQALGLDLHRTATGRLGPGPVQRGWIAWDHLDRLAAHPLVRRIEPARPAVSLAPLATIGEQQGTLAAHLRPDDGVIGDGVVVAVIDGPVDVAHPHFFHADGGVHAWIDRDGDGALGGGDAVELDGEIAPLVVLDGGFIDPLVAPGWQNFDGVLDPQLDWVFADVDGDGARGVGAAQGFSDDDPALGEPLFVAHDADGDGRMEPDERLFRLGSSKIRQVTVGPDTWRRGEDLAAAVDVGLDVDANHGTAVASILLGGQPGFQRRIGLAPGAEYIGYSQNPGGVSPFADAAEHGALVMLHEWSQLVGQPGDGSSLYEQAMDAARAEGMLQVCPLGNMNRKGKQIERPVSADGVGRLALYVPPGFSEGAERRPYTTVIMHVAWTVDAPLEGGLWRVPGVGEVELQAGGRPQPLGDDLVYAAQADLSPRGTRWLQLYVWNPEGGALPDGGWGIELYGLPAGAVMSGRVTDDLSGWSEGVAWVPATADRTSLTHPSTADSAIGVAAFGGRMELDEPDPSGVGELRAYSGRGPRIDGARAVDIAAPDDPLAALASSALPGNPLGHSALFLGFGGTSGAGPHVAAALALYAARWPELSADELEAHLLASADAEALVPDVGLLPNDGWGFGKLRTHFALYDAPAPSQNRPPTLEGLRRDEAVIEAIGAVDPDDDALRFRIDVGYDGEWDGTWQSEPTFELPAGSLEPGADFAVRVVVRDVRGAGTARVMRIAVPLPPPPDAGPPDVGPVAIAGDRGWMIIDAGAEGDGGALGCAVRPGWDPSGAQWGLVALLIVGVGRRRGRRITVR